MRARSLMAAFGLCLCAVLPAQAQRGVRGRIAELLSFGSCGAPLCLDNSVNATNGHGMHFIPTITASNGALVDFLADAIAANASNLPLAATGSGVTYKFVGGLPVRTTTSLGPVFGERAQTLGRGRFVFGANMSSLNFTTLRGVPLDGLLLNFSHDDVDPPGLGRPLRENDVLQVRLHLNVNLLVTTFFTTWGLTDGVDVGVATDCASVAHASGASVAFRREHASDRRSLPFNGHSRRKPSLPALTNHCGSASGKNSTTVILLC